MPASLSEAFKDPKIDSSVYTRSTLDSLKNPQFGGDHSYNSHIVHSGVSAHPYGVQFGGAGYYASSNSATSTSDYDIVNSTFRNNQVGGGSPSNNDTVSLLSSISTSSLSNEAEMIKQKYHQIENFAEDDDVETKDNKKCDLYVYHILSCSKCRNKMKKLLQDDKDEFQNDSSISLKELKDLLGGGEEKHNTFKRTENNQNYQNNVNNNPLNLDFNYLMENDNLQNISMFVISGIFLILLLDFFRKL